MLLFFAHHYVTYLTNPPRWQLHLLTPPPHLTIIFNSLETQQEWRKGERDLWIGVPLIILFVMKIYHHSLLLLSTQKQLHPPEPPPSTLVTLILQWMQQRPKKVSGFDWDFPFAFCDITDECLHHTGIAAAYSKGAAPPSMLPVPWSTTQSFG
jgi:hypothetical protein